MITEISAAVSAATNLSKLAQGLLRLSKDVAVQQAIIEINGKVIELQSLIFDAQRKAEEDACIKRELEQKLEQNAQWEEEKKRYELHQLAPSITVYALKAGDTKGEPTHYLCTQCFIAGQKSILQRPKVHLEHYKCNKCNLEFSTQTRAMPRVVHFPSTYGGHTGY